MANDALRLGALDLIEKTWDVGNMLHRIKSVLTAFGQHESPAQQ